MVQIGTRAASSSVIAIGLAHYYQSRIGVMVQIGIRVVSPFVIAIGLAHYRHTRSCAYANRPCQGTTESRRYTMPQQLS